TITYALPTGVQKAQMLFYNADGRLINSVDLDNKQGKGQLNVFANDLTNGVYTYTLVVDGKIIDTKRMVKNK
ncbi:MAG TPA: T9SS type A sorting domain-containing protein, partial [Flavobacteriales bacterium]|nr:T9SS type A sorting domain-containing protein [Flavobacteriales bacterium]